MRIVLEPGAIGREAGAVEHEVDERWLMAFAAGVADFSEALFDPARPGGLIAHPSFSGCLEWPLVCHGAPGVAFHDGDPLDGLHLTHDITVHRPIRPGDVLRTSAVLLAVEQRSMGILARIGFHTADAADGTPVGDTVEGILYPGAVLEGEATPPGPRPERREPLPASAEVATLHLDVADAVVYSECARIFNAVHSNVRVARERGLDRPLLHGSATLARSASIALHACGGGDPAAVSRVAGRFAGGVPLPSTVVVAAQREDGVVRFDARTPDGAPALADGGLELR